jgi:enterochelin esterase family protein
LTRLADTDVWYKTYLLRSDMRLSYSFVPDPTPESLAYHSELQLRDPLNPLYLPNLANIGHSVLQLPDAPAQPWIAPVPGVPTGNVEEIQVESKVLNSQRRAWIYLPAGYDANRSAPYPLLVCFDGWVYSNPEWVPTPVILDNLIHAGKIPPMIAVFIDQLPQPKRNLELSNNPEFADFVANELVPLVRKKWRATSDPAQIIACGSSAGGLASAYVAFRHPDVFGNVLSQSGAFWPGKTRDNPEREWLTRQFETSPRLPLRFVLQVGILEIGPTPLNGPSILVTNRHLKDVLRAKGYEVHYSEVAGGHEPLAWRGGVAEGLVQLQGSESKHTK